MSGCSGAAWLRVAHDEPRPNCVCHEREGGIDVEDRIQPERCCTRDGGGPSGIALQGEVPNHRKLRRSRAGVVSVAEKARRERVRCEPRRRARANR